MTADVRVAVVGAGRWAQVAHILGWQRDPRAAVVALADVNEAVLADAAMLEFGVARVTTDYRELLDDPGIDVIDVVTGNQPHFQISWDALSAGKHVLCEKPVHRDARQTRAAAEPAAASSLRTKLGFHVPGTRQPIQYAKQLIDSGFVGEPYVFNGFEQNSQWIDPSTPLRRVRPGRRPRRRWPPVSSIEGYGARVIDIMHWWLGFAAGRRRRRDAQLRPPKRMIRDTGKMTRANIDDEGTCGSPKFASVRSPRSSRLRT